MYVAIPHQIQKRPTGMNKVKFVSCKRFSHNFLRKINQNVISDKKYLIKERAKIGVAFPETETIKS